MINLRNEPGLFISVEGPEYSGKSTTITTFEKETSLDVVKTFEPGATEKGKHLRQWVTNPEGPFKHNQNIRAMAFAMDRAIHVEEVIQESLRKGKIVITDRYIDSSYVLQGIIQNKPLEEIDFFNCQANQIGADISRILPLKTIYIDITEQTAIERSKMRGHLNKMDEEFMERFKDIRNGYLELARKNPERYIVLDGNRTIEEVQQDFRETIHGIIKEYRPNLFK